MGSTDDFSAWLATNPIDLDVGKLDPENIIRNEHGDDDTETEEETDVKTGAMLNLIFEENTLPVSTIPDIKEKKRGRNKHKYEVLVLICGWKFCSLKFSDWAEFYEHISREHLGEVRCSLVGQQVVRCRWQGCGYGSQHFAGIRRHLNMHCYQV